MESRPGVLRFDASSAECLVFTDAAGLLSAVAHDLKIRVGRFTVEADEAARSVEGHFDAGSLRVVAAMRGEAESPGSLRDSDKQEIERNIVRDVLDAARHPEIRFVSSAVREAADELLVDGTLTIRGTARRIQVPLRRVGDCWVAEVSLHQPDFGIRPYTAMLGALRVKPEVRVRLTFHVPPGAAP